MNARPIGPCRRRTFHAAHTAALNRQIFQHTRFPSDASAYGCITATYATPTHGRSSPGTSAMCPLM